MRRQETKLVFSLKGAAVDVVVVAAAVVAAIIVVTYLFMKWFSYSVPLP